MTMQRHLIDDKGRIWEVASDTYSTPHAVVILPIDSIYETSPEELLEIINNILVPKALQAKAEDLAHHLNEHESEIRKGYAPYDIATVEKMTSTLSPFTEFENIAHALCLVNLVRQQLLQKAQKAIERENKKPQTRIIRNEIAANYESHFMKIGRRDGFHCQHCNATTNIQIDHIQPVSKGGNNDLTNLQLLCGSCNIKKSDKEVSA